MRLRILAILAMAASQAEAAGQTNAEWYQSLMVPGTVASCCAEAHCHRTPSAFRDGVWWAESEYYPGEWVPIPSERILSEANPFKDAVLCEYDMQAGNGTWVKTQPSGKMVWVFCFIEAPSGV